MQGLGADDEGYVGSSDLKFARMVGLDDVFTVVGLKEDSKNRNRPSTKASQSVDDYIGMISEIEKDLQDSPDLLAFYQSLTPGYRKDWARYVYSAKQEATQVKRRQEMKTILGEGYKSRIYIEGINEGGECLPFSFFLFCSPYQKHILDRIQT